MIPDLKEVRALDNYRLWLKYADGTEGEVDLSELVGQGVFAVWNDYREFQRAHVGEAGQISWSADLDLCADAMYMRLTGKSPEELIPALRRLVKHA